MRRPVKLVVGALVLTLSPAAVGSAGAGPLRGPATQLLDNPFGKAFEISFA